MYCVTLYELWFDKNKAWQNNPFRSPHLVGQVAATNFAAYNDVNQQRAQENMLELMASEWIKPGANSVKVNVDFVAFTSLNDYGICVIIRDEFGQFKAARVQRFEGSVAPYLGESKAAKYGILLAQELGIQRIKLEVDAKNVWKSISEGDQDRSYGGNILTDIFVYSSCFLSFTLHLDKKRK